MCEKQVNIMWFRHGLRIHDNPALIESIKGINVQLLPIFTFDGESAGTKSVGFNRMKFLLDSLNDLNDYFKKLGGKLHLIEGQPDRIFSALHKHINISKIAFEQDCEPIWEKRDKQVKSLNIPYVEKVSHTLWNPDEIIKTNGGIPPLTYEMFLHTVQILGLPPRPVEEPKWEGVTFPKLPEKFLTEFNVLDDHLSPERFNIFPSSFKYLDGTKWKGGEVQGLINLTKRLQKEEYAFRKGVYLPNQAMPNIIENPMSLSAHLRFGCLSVRKFYWEVHDLFEKLHGEPSGAHITGQLIWREYFYTMSVKNPFYGQMENNQICLNIPWAKVDYKMLDKWCNGNTGFPLIDAAMRQLLAEGWLHHILRNTVATFLTRGGLWYSWEHGFQHFLKHLLDADWSVCAGNWMWVSSSAFEHLLDTSACTSPLALSRRLDPEGLYIRHFVPELKNVPNLYIHEPWNMPIELQKELSCIIGVNYPNRIIDLQKALVDNNEKMLKLRESIMGEGETPPHCRPSNNEEIRQFFWLHN